MTTKANQKPALTNWQKRALGDLRAQAHDQPDLLKVGKQNRDDEGNLQVQFAITTTDLPAPAPAGLTFKKIEEFTLVIAPTDDQPPTVAMTHHRFIGTPHVLSGFYLCLYLDVSREWNPKVGINGLNGVLHRLWDWMTKATQNDFNPDTALYHAVGGVPHITLGNQAIVVRDLPPARGRTATAYLHRRTPFRLDLTTQPGLEADNTHVPVFFVDTDMPLGAGRHYLGALLVLVRDPRLLGINQTETGPESPVRLPSRYEQARIAARHYACDRLEAPYRLPPIADPYITTPDAALFTALVASASRNPVGTPQRLILAVPHPVGGAPHLLALELSTELSDELRDIARNKRAPLIEYVPERINPYAPFEWCFVSDERTNNSTRRDVDRPVATILNKSVLILGCGGLGSWIAEFVVRAGAKRVILSDNGRVTGGLLVRQNYTETDNGKPKILALGERLNSISDNVTIEVEENWTCTTADLTHYSATVDLIIDATISLKMSNQLDIVAAHPQRTATIAQVATDARTGTLGYATINPAGNKVTMTQMDHHLRDAVRADSALERYRYFWEEPAPGDELVPTRGCSAPTFHGSAADLAALSGGLITLIAKHLMTPAHGSHLIALPHADVQPSHKYLPCQSVEVSVQTDPVA